MRQNGTISLDFAAKFVNFYEPIEYTVNGKQLHDMEKLRVNQQFTLHELLRGGSIQNSSAVGGHHTQSVHGGHG